MWNIPEQLISPNGESLDSEERVSNGLFKDMGDVELVLRFFSYRQRGRLQRGLSLEKYLDKFLEQANDLDESTIKAMGDMFRNTTKLAYDLFGEQAFWMLRCRKEVYWSWFERATTAIYDPMMYVLSENLEKKDILVKNKREIINSIEDFYKNNYSTFEGRNTNPASLDRRDIAFDSFFKRFV
ncbi:hypothetical protein DVP78_23215 [Yersinia enterocolitica]|nr:hypothetical protein [Yersinia enterocolitica]